MRDETLVALKAWRSSRAVALDEQKFKTILADIRTHSDAELWLAIAPRKTAAKKPADPLLTDVKASLAKYKAAAAPKAERLVRYMLPHRVTMPKSMPAALKILRSEFTDAEIGKAADELMQSLLKESGTDVPL